MILGIQFFTKLFSQKSLYEHFGFELVGKAKVPNSNVNHYGLLRNKKKF